MARCKEHARSSVPWGGCGKVDGHGEVLPYNVTIIVDTRSRSNRVSLNYLGIVDRVSGNQPNKNVPLTMSSP